MELYKKRYKAECIVIDNAAVCRCREGFSGLFCDENPCDPNPCKNKGECSQFDDGAFCTCAEGFEGSFCEVERKLVTKAKIAVTITFI